SQKTAKPRRPRAPRRKKADAAVLAGDPPQSAVAARPAENGTDPVERAAEAVEAAADGIATVVPPEEQIARRSAAEIEPLPDWLPAPEIPVRRGPEPETARPLEMPVGPEAP